MTKLEKLYQELIESQTILQNIELGMRLKEKQLRKAQEDYREISTKYVKLKREENEKLKDKEE